MPIEIVAIASTNMIRPHAKWSRFHRGRRWSVLLGRRNKAIGHCRVNNAVVVQASTLWAVVILSLENVPKDVNGRERTMKCADIAMNWEKTCR